jgi:hypothetical protein
MQRDCSWRDVSACPRALGAQAYEFVDADSGEDATMQMPAYRDHSPTQRQQKASRRGG